MGKRETTAGLVALGVVGLGVCCGLPLLLSAGILGAVAGVGLGSWLLIGAGLAVATLGLGRRYQRRHSAPESDPAQHESIPSNRKTTP